MELNVALVLLMFGVFIALLFTGYPVAWVLAGVGLLFALLGEALGAAGFEVDADLRTLGLVVDRTYDIMSNYGLVSLPLFIFMGHMLDRSGIADDLLRAMQSLLAGTPGGLAISASLLGVVLAAGTGIIGASVALLGTLALPAMLEDRYQPELALGTVAASGCLGILIPPSVLLVVLGPVLGVSVIHLFAAAIIPGIILSGLYIAYTIVRCLINPELGPPIPPEQRLTSGWAIFREFISGVVPMAVIIFAALGSIIAGLATPTEAAAMAAVGSLGLALGYRRLSWKMLREAALNTLETSSLVLFLAVASNVYGSVFTRLGTGTMLANWLLEIPMPPLAMLALLMVVLFLLGWPLEWPAIVFIFVPIFLPVIISLGSDLPALGIDESWADKMRVPHLVWFGTLLAVNLQTAFLSPPVAMAAYYLKSVAPQWDLLKIYGGMFDFMMLQCVGLAIVFFVPEVALWLPSVLFK